MLRKLSNEIANCHAHAETCARKAAEATTDQGRDDYHRLQQHWLLLARSYELGERLGDFAKESARRQAEFDRTNASPHEHHLFDDKQDGPLIATLPRGLSRNGGEEELPPVDGAMDELIRALDWSKTSLGPISAWPSHLKATVSLMLPAQAQIVLFWGPQFVALYNNAYAQTIGAKHPRALGRPACENWAELWEDLEPLLRRVRENGETVFAKDRRFYIERHGYPENVYFDISYSPVRDEAGKVGGVLCIVSETTDRVLAQERQRLLLHETNHRLKNLFAMIDAMISLSVRSARTPQEFARAIRGRLAALLRAKELIRPGIMGTEHVASERTTVDALVRTILQPYDDGNSPERISASGPDVAVGAAAVTSLALALHESATNAVKYGALSEPNGAIRIKWETRDDHFHLEWEETGGPAIVVPPKAEGFGSILTEQSVTNQLGGEIAYDWRHSGLKLTLTIPLDRLKA
jgi:PAS domain S-box-containing protein